MRKLLSALLILGLELSVANAQEPSCRDAEAAQGTSAATGLASAVAPALAQITTEDPVVLEDFGVALGTHQIPVQVARRKMLPRGSAMITSSGRLEAQGIKNIIHAASGSMTLDGKYFSPSLEGIVGSIKSSFALARAYGYDRVAIPFIGGRIFIKRMNIDRAVLANLFIDTVLANRGGLKIRLVGVTDEETEFLQEVMKSRKDKINPDDFQVVGGPIYDFNRHHCSVIVNSANMEVQFGGGISGEIADATGKAKKIDYEASRNIRELYRFLRRRK